MILQKYNVETG